MHTKIDPNVRKMVTIILLVSTFISLMSQTMMITALPVIQHDFHRSLNTVQWLTTGYTLMIGVITPLSSNLYECFTNRQVFLGYPRNFHRRHLTGLRGKQFWDAFGCPFDSGLRRGNADVVSNDHHDLDLPARKAGFDPRPLFPGNCRWTGDWSVHGRADPTFFKLALPLSFGAPLHGVGLCTELLHVAQLLNAPPHSHRLLFGGHLFDWFRPDPRFL